MIKQYKLITGEVIICPEITPPETSPTSPPVLDIKYDYVMYRPFSILMARTPEGIAVDLIPFMNEYVFIKESAIIAVSDCQPQLEYQYLQRTTNIQLPANF